MTRREAMARRYCIIRRENPDELFEGEPIWVHGARDIDAMMLMLDTFGIEDLDIEKIFTDSHGQTEVGFAFCHLLGLIWPRA